ncbi:peptidoglycan-binding domain-containing protein [Hyalangium rubrum]|uniref:Peptidoglycan-binding domain-containing protein n=1 Tax=Hyalangium rubrum TaxID=3103134 RepID=A0ABU5HA40_9BACT|nr:peptidoglycan-binding domain-containing protein [Hyalangium sp. s54d21]MDY7229724.1 peptidoglycan-binding domain-containing protein [Hyalangium sp. s54d21]
MSNTILPKLFQVGVTALAKSGGDPVQTVQNAVTQVRQAVDTFATTVSQRAQEGRLFSQFAWGPMGEPFARQLTGVNVGGPNQRLDPVGPEDSVAHGVEIVQRFLDRLGYLDADHQLMGTFNGDTEEAVRQFQRDNGLEPTGIVDDATVAAMQNPRPRPGYGMPTTNGRFDPNGAIALSQTLFQEAANVYGAQLGLATSAAVTQPDGSVRQSFENGTLVMGPQGGFRMLDREGNSLLSPQDYAATQARAGSHFINQLEGDPDRAVDGNQNCGYASANMALSYLGVPGWSVEGMTPAQSYESTLRLREMGQPGSDELDDSTPDGIEDALLKPEMQAAGVEVTVWENDYNGARQSDADRMALAFMNGENDNIAFVVAGNPNSGWGETEGMDAHYASPKGVFDGGHFVSVVGYNADTDTFLVLDPMATGPIEVPRNDMATYMENQLVVSGEVLQITYNPSATQAQP